MRHDDMNDGREQISRMEAIAYVGSMLPDFVTLAASQPTLQFLLKMAQLEAHEILMRFAETPAGQPCSLSGDDTY